MARISMPSIVTLLSLIFGSPLVGQEQLPQAIYDIRPAVVKLEIHLKDFHDKEIVPDQLKTCFEESDYCVIGTGVRINDDGDVLTAAHVARDTTAVAQTLRDVGITSEVMVAGQARNAEYVKKEASSVVGASSAVIKAVDSEHDIAVFAPDRNAPSHASVEFDDHRHSRKKERQEVTLDTQRPNAGEAVFAFGFPMYSAGLITTPGSVTLAAGSRNLIEAHKNGDTQLVPVYRVGLLISPGNTGGPVFRASDGTLLGIVSEIGNERDTVATIIPAAEIAKILGANAIQWSSAPLRTASFEGARSKHKKSKSAGPTP